MYVVAAMLIVTIGLYRGLHHTLQKKILGLGSRDLKCDQLCRFHLSSPPKRYAAQCTISPTTRHLVGSLEPTVFRATTTVQSSGRVALMLSEAVVTSMGGKAGLAFTVPLGEMAPVIVTGA
jgi:hypothetical protein